MTAWSEEDVARITQLWNDGYSAAQIATILGGVTRNAVLGKVHRLGLHRSVTELAFEEVLQKKRLEAIERAKEAEISAHREAQLDRYLTISRRNAKKKLVSPPGALIFAAAKFVYSKRAFERVFMPMIGDMREEHYDALAGGRRWQARYVTFRGHVAFAVAVVMHGAVSMGRFFHAIWRIGS